MKKKKILTLFLVTIGLLFFPANKTIAQTPPECPGRCEDVACEPNEKYYPAGDEWCQKNTLTGSLCCVSSNIITPTPPPTECDRACNNNCTPTCVGVSDEYLCKVQRVTGGIEICCCYPPGRFPGAGIQPKPCQQGTPQEGIQTALGCIPTQNANQFVAWALKLAISIGGGIAFLLILFAGFNIITSAGDPQKLQAGKELLTSAIMGLILIIFSLFLLQLIGVKILQIPEF